MNNFMLRLALTSSEQRKLRKISRDTGVPMARLAADAIRKHVLSNKGE